MAKRLVLFGVVCACVASLQVRHPAEAAYWSYSYNVNETVTVTRSGDDPSIGIEMALEHFAVIYPQIGATPTCWLRYNTQGELVGANCRAFSNLSCTGSSGVWSCGSGSTLHCEAGEVRTATGCKPDMAQEDRCQATAANPVVIPTGQKIEAGLDFSTSGPRPLEFRRHYHSNFAMTMARSYNKPDNARLDLTRFGRGWRSNFDSAFAYFGNSPSSPSSSSRAHFATPSGTEIVFRRASNNTVWKPAYHNGSSWVVGRTDLDVSFEVVGTEARLIYGNGDVWAYGFDGKLQEIRFRDGYVQTLSYTDGRNTSVTDNLGRTLTFTYNANGLLDTMTTPDGEVYKYTYKDVLHLSSEIVLSHPAASAVSVHTEFVLEKVIYPDDTPLTDEDNPTLTYHYEDSNHYRALTGITDERGVRYATYAYDAEGRVTSSGHAGDVDTTTFSYDDTSNHRTVTNPLGKDTVYHFDNFQGRRRLIQVEGVPSANCAASDTLYAHDSNGYVNQETDGEGRVTKYVRNASGLPTTITEAFGASEERVKTVEWHASFDLPPEIVEPGRTTDLTYDTGGRLTELTQTDTTSHSVPYSTNGQTRTWTYTYSSAGLLLTADGPLAGTSDTVTYTYDANGYLETTTNEVGLVTTVLSVNDRGQPLTISDPNGIESELEYDERGRLTSLAVDTASQTPSVTSIEYDAIGQVIKITFPDTTYLDYEYDDARRLVSVTNKLGEKIEYVRDDMGNATGIVTKLAGGSTRFSRSQDFDELGRLLRSIRVASSTTTLGYDRTDLLTTITDPRSNLTSYAYDALMRLIRETDQEEAEVNYGLDGQDQVVSYTDPRSLVTSYVRNGFGEVIQETSPDSSTTIYVRDSRGLVTEMTDGRGAVTEFAYDAAGRLLAKTFPNASSEDVAYSYDELSTETKGKGRLWEIDDEPGHMRFYHGPLGEIVRHLVHIGTRDYDVYYDYDAAGRVTKITYPSGREVLYSYGDDGAIVTVETDAGSGPETVMSDIAHEPFGPFAAGTFGNGLTVTMGRNQDYDVAHIRLEDGSVEVRRRDYARSDLINITGIADPNNAANDEGYGYGPTNRLESATGPWGELTYTYDPVGNRTVRILTQGLSTTTEAYDYPTSSNRLIGIGIDSQTVRSFTYDGAGNITEDYRSGSLYVFTYNRANRPVSVTKDTLPWAAYTYNGLGQLAVRSTSAPGGPSDDVHYVYDLWGNLISEIDATTGDTLREVAAAGERGGG